MRLRSQRIVCPDGVVAGEVVVRGGLIEAVVRDSDDLELPDGPEHEERFELGRRWLLPGFIDVHVHGGGGAQCNSSDTREIAQVARFHARHGTTGLLATTVPAPLDDLLAALDAISVCNAPNLLGAHLEGPFLNPERPGALEASLFVDPDMSQLERLLEAGRGAVRLMTLAPELPGAGEVLEHLAHRGIVASIGHTSATDAQVREAVRAGARSATHLFNAMPPFHHRDPGAVGAVLDLAEVSCELICDGVHVAPVAMRLVHRAKGSRGIRLVTDAMAATGMPDGEYRLGGRTIEVTGGRAVLAGGQVIAGSTLTMEAAVQNAVHHIGVSVQEAALMSSANSARLLGLHDRKGAIAPGLDSDLVVLSDRLTVVATMIAGQWLAGSP